ncbi:MAG: hypothetical protein JWR84_2991 [Caulobacter sp.]|nr:hypothetical protein [Caulobacter sp.]
MLAPWYGKIPDAAWQKPKGPKRAPPEPGRLDPAKPQNRVALIEVSDWALSNGQVPWPPPREYYAGVLGALAGGEGGPDTKPAAIFLDYAFLSTTSGADSAIFQETIRAVVRYQAWRNDIACRTSALAKIRCIVGKGGIPVILGKGYPAVGDSPAGPVPAVRPGPGVAGGLQGDQPPTADRRLQGRSAQRQLQGDAAHRAGEAEALWVGPRRRADQERAARRASRADQAPAALGRLTLSCSGA